MDFEAALGSTPIDREFDYIARLWKRLEYGEKSWFVASDDREVEPGESEPPVELYLSDCSTPAYVKTIDEKFLFEDSEWYLKPTTTDVDTFWYNKYEWGFNYRSKDAYKHVWEDWDAALIVSKQVKTPQTAAYYYAAGLTGKDDIVKGMTLEEYNTCLGRRNAREMLKAGERDVTAQNGFQLQPSWGKEEDNHLIEPNVKKAKTETNYDPDRKKEVNEAFPCASWSVEEPTIAKGIAALCFRAMARARITCFETKFTESDFKVVKEDVLRSAAKFVMSVFDMEDFLRIGYGSVVDDEYSSFSSCLRDCKCDDPLVAVAEGLVKVDGFPALREHDICDIIRQYKREQPYYEDKKVSPWLFFCNPAKLDNICKSDLRIVGEEMQKFVRLKADRKMQLELEMLHMKGFHVLDNLVLEALAGINFREIEKLTADYKDTRPSIDCSIFLKGIYGEFYGLSTMKSYALKHFLGAVTYPLLSRGPCTSELLEVIKIADHERRMERQRLISTQHLLYGLSLSRVGNCVKEILNDRGMKPSTLSTFGIYKLSHDAADRIGDNEVGLEHLVLAIFFGKQENSDTRTEPSSLSFVDTWDAELLECLRNSNAKCSVNRLTESHVFNEFLPEDCHDGSNVRCDIITLVKKLEKAMENGLKLLAIREEN